MAPAYRSHAAVHNIALTAISAWLRSRAMDSTPRPPVSGSQRTLAAILFTDVVGFSARMQRADIKPARLGNIVVALLRETPMAPPRDVILGAQAFARVYNLPAMHEAVTATRPRRDKD